jgi:hypothetical protein
MRPSNKSKKNIKKKTDTKYILNTIELEENSKFKNEIFQKLYENNLINKYGNLHLKPKTYFRSPEIGKKANNLSEKKRNKSYLYSVPKIENKMKMSDSKSKKNIHFNSNSNNASSSRIIKTSKVKKINSNNSNNKKSKNYPNLINGVLHQAKFYNKNKNNYNDDIRYKPLDDYLNEQIQSTIYIGDINENNPISSNYSFFADCKQEQKDNNQYNTNIDLKLESKDNYLLNNNNDNYSNKNPKINDERNSKELSEKEVKIEKVIYKKHKKNGNNINCFNYISPIKKINNDKADSNEITLENFNSDVNKRKSSDNININYNENININDNENIRDQAKDKNPNIEGPIEEIKETIKESEDKESERKNVLEKENICSFEIDGDDKKKEKVFDSDLQPTSGDNFIINNDKIKEKENNFNNLEINNCSILNYIGKKIKKRIKGQRYDKDGNLIFNNDDEVLRYIKDRIKEEKDMEYDNKKIKYNYFKLIKLFHGKLLYEIGLENNLDKINEILDKENVEIEHEPVMFIFKKDLNNHPKKEISDNSNQNLPDKQMKKLEKEKKELIRKIEKLQKIVDFQEKNSKKFNEYEYSKLKEDLQRMKEENKKKEYIINGLQNSINEFQNLLNNYEVKIKEYEEMYNKIEPEKDKYEKSILKLLEYNVQMINEYQKLKSQLKQQSNNNNCFNNETLKIKKADYFDILNNEDNNKRIIDENNQEKEEEISTQYDIIHYDFNDVNNNDNMKTIDNFDNNNEKKKYNKKQKAESMNRALQRIKNMRENSQKKREEKDNMKKSIRISEMAQKLEKKFNEKKDNNYNDDDE